MLTNISQTLTNVICLIPHVYSRGKLKILCVKEYVTWKLRGKKEILSRVKYRRMVTLVTRNQKQEVVGGRNEASMKSRATGKRKVWEEKNDMKSGRLIYIILDANFKNILKVIQTLAFSEYLKQQQGIQMPFRDGKREIRSGS